MTWTYEISSGQITYDGLRLGTGYSGTKEARNDPERVGEQGVGPIPPGRYHISDGYDHPHLGPCVMNLDPVDGTDTFGRSLFRIHGDNSAHDASHGCIILNPGCRRAIATSHDKVLEVTR